MSLKDSFCPSPWFHMRINNSGYYEYCRWANKSDRNNGPSINDVTPAEFFQTHMQPIRQSLLDGNTPAGCNDCPKMEQHGKISGRQRQLLKVGVRVEYFEKSLASSPWVNTFASPTFNQMPQDWQIDLGNYCNSACVMCNPASSSRIAMEWKKIGFTTEVPTPTWVDSPELVNKLIDTLQQSQHIQYLHFIGGETLITPAFKVILKALIDAGLHKTATLGFTTNLISWDESVVELLTKFKGLNLGVSIEAFDHVNDYVRWPATMPKVTAILDKWTALAAQHGWLMQIRTTPTTLTISRLLSVYKYAWQQGISVESCNFLSRPDFLRPSVLPLDIRTQIVTELEDWVSQHQVGGDVVVNTRAPDVAHQQIVQDLQSYINYLKNEPDESHRLPEMVSFIKRLEANRGNSILTYLPEYEELLRAAGY